MKEIISKITKDYLFRLMMDGKRIDGRDMLEHRDIKIEPGFIGTAEGSARIKLGDTDVIVGIKMDTGEPFPDTPDKGVVITSAELIPLASPKFESGPPREDATELARVVDRGIREGNVVDVTKLCIEEGEKVWLIFIDMHILDFDGNLFDACGIGAMAALMNTIVPAERHELGDDYQLPIEHTVVPTTFTKIKKQIILDSRLEEEQIAEARLTIGTNEDGDIVAMQKGLSGVFDYEDTLECINNSRKIGGKIRKMLIELSKEDKV
ncbi:MAG: exosome complex protein Rrp42 [Thermoplasmata archaeon]